MARFIALLLGHRQPQIAKLVQASQSLHRSGSPKSMNIDTSEFSASWLHCDLRVGPLGPAPRQMSLLCWSGTRGMSQTS